jgi:hypothetical protein
MLSTVGWTLALYAALKLCHLVLGGRTGWDGAPEPISVRLRKGEPTLLIGTIAAVAVLLLFTSWWSHKFAAGHYAYAMSCYPRLAAAGSLPGGSARFGGYDAEEAVREMRRGAEEQGAALGIPQADTDRTLERTRLAAIARARLLGERHDRRTIAAAIEDADRCLKGQGAPRGELFNP